MSSKRTRQQSLSADRPQKRQFISHDARSTQQSSTVSLPTSAPYSSTLPSQSSDPSSQDLSRVSSASTTKNPKLSTDYSQFCMRSVSRWKTLVRHGKCTNDDLIRTWAYFVLHSTEDGAVAAPPSNLTTFMLPSRFARPPTPELPTPKPPSPELPMPEPTTPGLPTTPDLPTPDLPTPDLPTPDLPTPDLPTPDLPTTPDIPTQEPSTQEVSLEGRVPQGQNVVRGHATKGDASLVRSLEQKIGSCAKGARDVWDTDLMLYVARHLESQSLFDPISQHDLSVVGMALLADIFGPRGQKRLADALVALYSTKSTLHDDYLLESNASSLATSLQNEGPHQLSSFARCLSEAVRPSSHLAILSDIRLLRAKTYVVQEWDRWSHETSVASTESDAISLDKFLCDEGIPSANGVNLLARVSTYLSRKLGVPQAQLSKRIYAWRPISILEKTFGPGVLALVPSSFLTYYNRLQTSGTGLSKEERLRRVARIVQDRFPQFERLCKSCEEHVVQYVPSHGPSFVPAVKESAVLGVCMAAEGKTSKLATLPLFDMFSEQLLSGNVCEVEDGKEMVPDS